MRAAVVNAIGAGFDIEDLVIDEPMGHEVLIEVRAAGLCHSDLHFANHDFGTPLPAVLGHELAGVVLAVGPQVREVSVGDHVVASLVRSCGHCLPCSQGEGFRCRNKGELLRSADAAPRLRRADGTAVFAAMGTAAFAEQALVHERQLVAIPTDVPFAPAAILGCGVLTGVGTAVNTAQVAPGDTVAVVGVGGVGLNVISGARLAGAARIVAVDTQPDKLELAARFGATDAVDASQVDPVAAVKELTGGVHHAFEVVGLEATTVQAVRMTAVGGSVYLVGLHRPGSTTTLNMLEDVLVPQRSIVGTYMGSGNLQRDIPMYARLYLEGRLNLDGLISREIGIDEINAGFEAMQSGLVARSVITRWS